jgi:hypothetical protein
MEKESPLKQKHHQHEKQGYQCLVPEETHQTKKEMNGKGDAGNIGDIIGLQQLKQLQDLHRDIQNLQRDLVALQHRLQPRHGTSEEVFLRFMLKPGSLETFNGFTKVEDFIKQFNRLAQASGLTAQGKWKILPLTLGQTATLWMEEYERAHPVGGGEITEQDWNALLEDMTTTFSMSGTAIARTTLLTREQGPEEPFNKYYFDMLDKCNDVDERMPESEKIEYILRGMKEEWRRGIYEITTEPTRDQIVTNVTRWERKEVMKEDALQTQQGSIFQILDILRNWNIFTTWEKWQRKVS